MFFYQYAGQVIHNLAYDTLVWGSTDNSLSIATNGGDFYSAIVGNTDVWTFVAVDLGSSEALGLIRIKLMIPYRSEYRFITSCVILGFGK